MELVTVALAASALLLDKEDPSAAAVERRSPLKKPSQRRTMSVDVEMTALAPPKERPASVALRRFMESFNEVTFFTFKLFEKMAQRNITELEWVTPAKRSRESIQSPPPSHGSPLFSSPSVQVATADPTPSSPIGQGPRLLFPESKKDVEEASSDSLDTPPKEKKRRVTLSDLKDLMDHVDALEADVALKAGRIKSLELTKVYLRDCIEQLKEKLAAPCQHCGSTAAMKK